ncbi:MAG: AAA family ATPase [Pseudomonadota bacterium]|nr:AAA family ATPase [Pseudomonadota bacterium]
MVNIPHEPAHHAGAQGDIPEVVDNVRPIPRVSIQAFCESEGVTTPMQAAMKDRRLAKTSFKVNTGDYRAALEHFSSAPTPNLVILEMRLPPMELIQALDKLADVCDPGTKVVVIGHYNDVQLYRELMRCGVSEYLVAPISLADVLTTISDIFVAPNSEPLGRSIAVLGAKGGVGASTIAHNVGWAIADLFQSEVILCDCDLAFGTANIDFDRDPAQGMYEALRSSGEMDETLLDRLLSSCGDHLSLLSAPSTLDQVYDLDANDFRVLVETAQKTAPFVILDLPHQWTDWTRAMLAQADLVVMAASLDLANLRNAKNLVDTLVKLRPNDAKPHLVLNQIGIPKRPEIALDEFCDPLGLTPAAEIPFDPQLFGEAANAGLMIRQLNAKSPIAATFDQLAHIVTGRETIKKAKKVGLFDRLLKKSAA